MKIKHIQALELFLHTFYKDKELVFDYKNRLFTANFLGYLGDSALTKNSRDAGGEVLSLWKDGLFASDSIKEIFVQTDSGVKYFEIEGEIYYLHDNISVMDIIKPLYKHILDYEEKSTENEALDIVPTNIKFLDKNNSEIELPFYLLDDNAEIDLVSVRDK